jgi:IS30 family transposase
MPKKREMKYNDRKIIEQRFKEGKSIAEIAMELGLHRDTIYRELRRVDGASENHNLYDATAAQLTV